jgi:hypothetical protein
LNGVNITGANMLDALMVDVRMARAKMDDAIGPHGKRIERASSKSKSSSLKRSWWQFWRS